MSKSLHQIQTLGKLGKVLSKIVFICCIVGAVLCLMAMVGLGVFAPVSFGNVTIHGILEDLPDKAAGTLQANVVSGFFLCLGEIILAWFAGKYFKNELADGTPFTLRGAKEMKRLGVLTICVPLAAVMVAEIASGIVNYVYGSGVDAAGAANFVSVGLGILFLILSVVFRYGAELADSKET